MNGHLSLGLQMNIYNQKKYLGGQPYDCKTVKIPPPGFSLDFSESFPEANTRLDVSMEDHTHKIVVSVKYQLTY